MFNYSEALAKVAEARGALSLQSSAVGHFGRMTPTSEFIKLSEKHREAHEVLQQKKVSVLSKYGRLFYRQLFL